MNASCPVEPVTPRRRGVIATAAVAAALLALTACGDDDDSATATTSEIDEQAAVVVTLGDGTIDLPAEIPAGIVDIDLRAEDGEQSHHLVFARLNDGVSYDDLAAADEFETMVTFRGGNGSLAPGESTRLTLDLDPGDYQVIDLPDGEVAAVAATTAVDDDRVSATEPDARGTVVLGPGRVIQLPEGFDGTGTWEFDNVDAAEPHEAALVALEDGSTVEDVVAWATTFSGPPPGEIIGGFGAIAADLHGWADLGAELPTGDYAVVCLIPTAEGVAHAAQGMVAGFTVD